MNFFDYIGVTEDEFIEKYLQAGLVTESLHKEFPLNLFTYSRKAVHENVWDSVTSKCRGIIINRETDEIVARPFEKFHNYGSTQVETAAEIQHEVVFTKPCVIEKVDGFMCTLYTWKGQDYIASKGSFHSVHAKWATAELRKKSEWLWPIGFTPIFEGLCRDLRIVVDYGDRTGLVLLALVNIETGEELPPDVLKSWANINGITSAKYYAGKNMLDALEETLVTNGGTEEGYVLTWYNENAPPFRLKVKFQEYLRLHRMVTGVSPKRIWEVMSNPAFRSELEDFIWKSTPWFSKFVQKWMKVLQGEFDRLNVGADEAYRRTKEIVRVKVGQTPYENLGAERKAWALEFQRPENIEFAPILFAMLDDKRVDEVIWKRVRELTTNGKPMVDIHAL